MKLPEQQVVRFLGQDFLGNVVDGFGRRFVRFEAGQRGDLKRLFRQVGGRERGLDLQDSHVALELALQRQKADLLSAKDSGLDDALVGNHPAQRRHQRLLQVPAVFGGQLQQGPKPLFAVVIHESDLKGGTLKGGGWDQHGLVFDAINLLVGGDLHQQPQSQFVDDQTPRLDLDAQRVAQGMELHELDVDVGLRLFVLLAAVRPVRQGAEVVDVVDDRVDGRHHDVLVPDLLDGAPGHGDGVRRGQVLHHLERQAVLLV